MEHLWRHLHENYRNPELEYLHLTLSSRLQFGKAKLEGLEHYALMTLERLSLQC